MPNLGLQSPLTQESSAAVERPTKTKATPEAPPAAPFRPRWLAHLRAETAKVMIVDDEPINIKVVQKYLALVGYRHFVTTTDPLPALAMISTEMPDVILLDVVMPAVSGLEILRQVREDERLAHIPTIIFTASGGNDIKREALDLGATDFLRKPVNSAELTARVNNALGMKAYHDHLANYAQELQRQVQLRTAELTASRLELIHCLGRAAESRDNETGRHVVRVGRYAGIIARQLGADQQFVELIEHAAPLHDIGKIGIPDSILLKPGKLSPEESEIMQRHSHYGQHTFAPMSCGEWRAFQSHTFLGQMIMAAENSPIVAMAAQICLTHHEKWDGTGYPAGLSGERIPLSGRITAVADVFDALTSKRPYKSAIPVEPSLAIMEQGRGTHFDPKVLDAFLAGREAAAEVLMAHADAEPSMTNHPPGAAERYPSTEMIPG